MTWFASRTIYLCDRWVKNMAHLAWQGMRHWVHLLYLLSVAGVESSDKHLQASVSTCWGPVFLFFQTTGVQECPQGAHRSTVRRTASACIWTMYGPPTEVCIKPKTERCKLQAVFGWVYSSGLSAPLFILPERTGFILRKKQWFYLTQANHKDLCITLE